MLLLLTEDENLPTVYAYVVNCYIKMFEFYVLIDTFGERVEQLIKIYLNEKI